MHHGIATAIAGDFLNHKANRKELPQREADLSIFRASLLQKSIATYPKDPSVLKPLQIAQSMRRSKSNLLLAFFPVLKPLACSRQSWCLGWTYKTPGGQKFSIKLSPFSVGFPQRRPLNSIKRPQFMNSPRSAIYLHGPNWGLFWYQRLPH